MVVPQYEISIRALLTRREKISTMTHSQACHEVIVPVEKSLVVRIAYAASDDLASDRVNNVGPIRVVVGDISKPDVAADSVFEFHRELKFKESEF